MPRIHKRPAIIYGDCLIASELKHRSTCASHKIQFPSKLEAMIALVKCQEEHHFHRHKSFQHEPIRVYHCQLCGYWHLTHREFRA
ncbi:hypothetical protein L1O48_02500 [Ligilactobacillus equi]|uniref:hypothetical protein n=1 Tax=Ligilactobacillus equi TaxID=137357 RepID=UPI002ED012FC